MLQLTLIAGPLLLAIPAAPPPTQDSANALAGLREELRATVDALAEDGRFSGAVALARDGEVVFEGAWGLANRSFDVPNRVDTRFNLGSMNKMITAVAVLQLVERGELALDDALIEHLPDYPNREVAQQVTIRHLLTHTSGMGSFWEALFATEWTRIRTPAQHLPLFVDDPLQFEPGERFSYSNSGFLVLGLVIEAVSGETYYDYVREHVAGPAGMTSTESWAIDEVVPNLAVGYTRVDDEGHVGEGELRTNVFLHRAKGGPAGGGFSTVHDLQRFAQALLSGELLGPELLSEALRPQVSTGWGGTRSYGFGFLHEVVEGGREVVGHSGGAPGINGVLNIYPADGWTIAVLANVDGGASLVFNELEPLFLAEEG